MSRRTRRCAWAAVLSSRRPMSSFQSGRRPLPRPRSPTGRKLSAVSSAACRATRLATLGAFMIRRRTFSSSPRTAPTAPTRGSLWPPPPLATPRLASGRRGPSTRGASASWPSARRRRRALATTPWCGRGGGRAAPAPPLTPALYLRARLQRARACDRAAGRPKKQKQKIPSPLFSWASMTTLFGSPRTPLARCAHPSCMLAFSCLDSAKPPLWRKPRPSLCPLRAAPTSSRCSP